MITTIISWLYITLLCYGWGNMFMRFMLKTIQQENNILFSHFSIVCLTGLIIIAGVVQILSFFIPLHGWFMHIPFIIPCFFTSFSGINFNNLKISFRWLSHIPRQLLILLVLCILLILIMNTWFISHPDTLEYHIEIIKWIQQSKAVPGLANINTRLGLQSILFPVCAFFSFSHAGVSYYVHLNAIIVVWAIIFIISQIDKNREKKSVASVLWILLLSINLWSYSQIRLTVTSTSPDFIAAIYILFSIYFLYRGEQTRSRTIFTLTLSFLFFSFCTKLSSIPVVIPIIYISTLLVLERKYKILFVSLLVPSILLPAFLYRNVISSGYMFFPSTFLNIIDVNWKLNEEVCKHISAYVTAFAKTGYDSSEDAVRIMESMSIREWMPVWWHLRSLPDKIIISFSLLSFLIIIASVKKIRKLGITKIVCIITSITGAVFWFFLAPDPRFGFGFLLSLIGIAADISFRKKNLTYLSRYFLPLLLLLNISIGSYVVYRFNKYFSTKQIIYPMGTSTTPSYKLKQNNNLN